MKSWIVLAVLLVFVNAEYNQTLGKIFAQLTVASYCVQGQVNSWSCAPCKKAPPMKFVHVFKNRTNDTCGFIGVNDAEDAVILVMRGTLPWDIKNWVSDINFLKRKYVYCDNGCEVHRGFYEDYLDIANEIKSLVVNYTNTFKKSRLLVTGHSLGGALSTFAVAHLIHQGIHVDEYYSLGSPRVGDKKFQEWFDKMWGNRFKARITHNKDPVPHVPFKDWGFYHLGAEVFYNHDNSNYKVCDITTEDKTCSAKFELDLTVMDHLTYLGQNYVEEVILCQ